MLQFPALFLLATGTLKTQANNEVYTWGCNYDGQVGTGWDLEVDAPIFMNLSGKIAASLAFKYSSSSAITTDKQLYLWGGNDYGQIGDGSKTDVKSPKRVDIAGRAVLAADVGFVHAGAVTTDNKLYMWGSNVDGALGDGSTTDRTTPALVNVGNKAILTIALGRSHSSAITTDHKLFMWGNNYFAQIGDGTDVNKELPIHLDVNGEDIAQVSLGDYHSGVITKQGNLYTWGYDSNGQLGTNQIGGGLTPARVDIGFTFLSISFGGFHSGAVSENQQLYMFGYNKDGQLGDGSKVDSHVPLLISVDHHVVLSVALGEWHTGALVTDGSKTYLYTWGSNTFGQLGDYTTIDKSSPVYIGAIVYPDKFLSLSLGDRHSGVISTKSVLKSATNADESDTDTNEMTSDNEENDTGRKQKEKGGQ